MGDERSDALATLVTHRWPAGVSVGRDGDVLEVAAAPVGRVDLAVVAGIVIGIPGVVVLLFPTVQGVITAVLFAAAVLGLGYQRLKGLQRVTVDFAAGRVAVEHANPRIAQHLGLGGRTVGFADVASVEVTRTMPAARTEPHGRRVGLRLGDGTTLVLAEFTASADGATFARAVARLIGVSTEER